MKKRTLLSIAALTLISGWGDYMIQPQPAGAESEAGLEAPMVVGRRRHRRGYYGNQQNQMNNQQQKMQANILKQDQKQEMQHQKQLHRLHKKDLIKTYGPTGSN